MKKLILAQILASIAIALCLAQEPAEKNRRTDAETSNPFSLMPDELLHHIFLIEKPASMREIFNRAARLSLVDSRFKAIGGDVVLFNHLGNEYVRDNRPAAEAELFQSVKIGCRKIVIALLDFGLDLESKKSSLNSLLHLAAKKGQLEIVRLLLEKGADIHARNKRGHSPLYFACRRGNDEMIKLLVSDGANFTIDEITVCRNMAFIENIVASFDQAQKRALYSLAGMKNNNVLCRYLTSIARK